jgi:hypothetical protein
MKWMGLAARIGRMRNVRKILVGNLRETDQLGDTGVDGSILFQRWAVVNW